jgi:hypothetical protein
MSLALDKQPKPAPSSLRRKVVSSATLAAHRQVAEQPADPTPELVELMNKPLKAPARSQR